MGSRPSVCKKISRETSVATPLGLLKGYLVVSALKKERSGIALCQDTEEIVGEIKQKKRSDGMESKGTFLVFCKFIQLKVICKVKMLFHHNFHHQNS